jgi:hypothetical protein
MRDFLTLTTAMPQIEGMLAEQALTVIEPKRYDPVIGFRVGGKTVGLGGISQLALRNVTRSDDITWGGIAKVSAATLAAGAVVGVRAAGLAVNAGKLAVETANFSREQMLEKLALMQQQRDEAIAEAAHLRTLVKVPRKTQMAAPKPAKPYKKQDPARWTDQQLGVLAGMLACKEETGQTYKDMAAKLTERFGRKFTPTRVSHAAKKLYAS